MNEWILKICLTRVVFKSMKSITLICIDIHRNQICTNRALIYCLLYVNNWVLFLSDILRRAQQCCLSWSRQWVFCVVNRSGVTFFGWFHKRRGGLKGKWKPFLQGLLQICKTSFPEKLPLASFVCGCAHRPLCVILFVLLHLRSSQLSDAGLS